MVVDDNVANLTLAENVLEEHYDVMALPSGEKALKILEKVKPDLILLDIMMPGLDGFETLRRMKEIPGCNGIPVIFLTAQTEESNELEGLTLGAVDYITKPFSPPLLLKRVELHLKIVEQTREIQDLYDKMKAQIESELAVARDIQLSMLPKNFSREPQEPFAIYGVLEPAKEVGGDLYDFFYVDDNHFCFLVGDVSGKGVPASLFMAEAKTIIKAIAHSGITTEELLNKANVELCQVNESNMFVTVFLAILNLTTGEFRYTNAGHNPPYILRKNGMIEPLPLQRKPAVGVMDIVKYSGDEAQLAPGESIVLYTDGVTEANNEQEELFGEPRLEGVLQTVASQGPAEVTQAVLQEVKKFSSQVPQFDDITILTFQYQGQK